MTDSTEVFASNECCKEPADPLASISRPVRCWRRLLRVPWTARRSNQSILKEINAVYSLEGLMLKLKLQYLSHLMLGKTEAKSRRQWQRMR